MRAFLQAVGMCFLVFSCRGAAVSGEISLAEARRIELLRELREFRPPWRPPEEMEWMLSGWDTDLNMDLFLSFPKGEGNAGECFRRLEECYASEREALESGGGGELGVGALLEAAEMGECRLIPEYYPEFDSVEAKQPDFHVLRRYLEALLRRAERSAEGGDREDAERCYRAALLCGRHLTRDKSSSIVFVTGLIFKSRGAKAYHEYLTGAGDEARAAQVKKFSDAVALLMRAFMWKANVAMSEFENFACLPSVVRVAEFDVEPFWRKEAVVRLATLRYGVPDKSGGRVLRDVEMEKIADEALAGVASNDTDPTVRRFAVWCALNGTPDNYPDLLHDFGDASP